MSNVEISLPLVDGGLFDFIDFGESSKSIIHTLFTDDCRPPPRFMDITIKTAKGKMVSVKIPYDDQLTASVYVDDEKIE